MARKSKKQEAEEAVVESQNQLATRPIEPVEETMEQRDAQVIEDLKEIAEIEKMEILEEKEVTQTFEGEVLSEKDVTIQAKLEQALNGEDRKNSQRIRTIVENIAGKGTKLSIEKSGTIIIDLADGTQIKI